MPLHVLLALAATTATPVVKPGAAKALTEATEPAEPELDEAELDEAELDEAELDEADDADAEGEEAEAEAEVDPMEAMAFMTKMFDKFFPTGPEPDPARLALAREATLTMFPKGAYAQAMNGFANRLADRVLDMSEAELVAMFPPQADDKKDKTDAEKADAKKAASKKAGSNRTEAKKAEPAKAPPSTEPLRLSLARKEPNFDAKVAAVRAFAGVMFEKFGAVAEPRFREGMARALARKFDAAQIAEIRTFLATPTGAAYGREMVGMWFEPDVMRGTFEMLPDMIRMMPEITKDAAALDAQIKALGTPAEGKKAD